MDKKAAELMGEPVVAGSTIQTAGTGGATMTAGVGGALGGALGGAIASSVAGSRQKPGTLDHKGLMYMAAGPQSFALFSVKRGLLKNSIKEMLVKVPRSSVQAIDLGGGMLVSGLSVMLSDGTTYALEVPRAMKGKAQKVVKEMGFTPQ